MGHGSGYFSYMMTFLGELLNRAIKGAYIYSLVSKRRIGKSGFTRLSSAAERSSREYKRHFKNSEAVICVGSKRCIIVIRSAFFKFWPMPKCFKRGAVALLARALMCM